MQVNLPAAGTAHKICGGRMSQTANAARRYFCPMHSDVRQANPGKCPKCGMDLLREGTRFALFRHMISNPLHLVVMAALMVAVMVAVMMLMR
jgi:hypothetical protein